MSQPPKVLRMIIGVACAIILAGTFLLQNNFTPIYPEGLSPQLKFGLIKTARFLMNDLLMIGIIWSVYGDRESIRASIVVQLIGTFFLFVPYLILKMVFGFGNGPLISFLHRITVNPTLLLLLIPAIWIQRNVK